MTVVCVGDAFVDLLARVAELPQRGGASWSPPLTRIAGGTGANVAWGLAKLGVRTAFVGRVGDDVDGEFLAEDLSGVGIDVSRLVRDPDFRTGAAVGLIEPDGERTFIACAEGAAHTRLCRDDLRDMESLRPRAIFVTGISLLEEPSRSAMLEMSEAINGRVPIYFDPNLRQPGSETNPDVRAAMHSMAGMSEVILAGEEEMRLLGLTALRGQTCVIKSGAGGARLERDGDIVLCVAGHKVEVVDATGAGDAFDAAYIASVMDGSSDETALEFANAAAAISVTEQGSRTMPNRADAKRLINGRT